MFTEKVTEFKPWVATVTLAETVSAHVDRGRVHALRVAVNEYNFIFGEYRNVFVHVHYSKKHDIATLVCVTKEEHQEEITNPSKKNDWQKKIPEQYL